MFDVGLTDFVEMLRQPAHWTIPHCDSESAELNVADRVRKRVANYTSNRTFFGMFFF